MRLSPQLRVKHLAATIATAVALTPIIASCGTTNDESAQSNTNPEASRELRIIDAPRTITLDDLTDLGMKVGKEYDISTLQGATSANLLYWRVQGTAVEYEIRMYGNHADALNLGDRKSVV